MAGEVDAVTIRFAEAGCDALLAELDRVLGEFAEGPMDATITDLGTFGLGADAVLCTVRSRLLTWVEATETQIDRMSPPMTRNERRARQRTLGY